MEAENHGIGFSVTPNAKFKGAISGRSRQVDILIDGRWSVDVRHRRIVDTKCDGERSTSKASKRS
jgi:hypothetical protein